MKKILQRICIVVLLMACASTSWAAGYKEAGPTDLLKAIGDAKGKVVVVNFFATWCPPCREEIPDLIEVRKEIPEETMLLLGVSVDESASDLDTMMQETGFNYPIYLADRALVETFGISSIPRLLIYDKKGQLVIDHVGIADRQALSEAINKIAGE